jgi:hypothetical protein
LLVVKPPTSDGSPHCKCAPKRALVTPQTPGYLALFRIRDQKSSHEYDQAGCQPEKFGRNVEDHDVTPAGSRSVLTIATVCRAIINSSFVGITHTEILLSSVEMRGTRDS